MLAAVENVSADQGIKNSLKILAAKLRNDNEEDEDAAEALKQVADSLNDYSNQDIQMDRLNSYEYYLDRQLPDFLNRLQSKINDNVSALQAINGFNIEYFRNIPMSQSAKQQIAATLCNLTQQYIQYENTFWRSITDGNVEVLDLVSFHIDTSENSAEGDL